MFLFSLARELGFRITDVLGWSAIEIGYWRAFASLDRKTQERSMQVRELRDHALSGLTDIKGKMKHGNHRSRRS